MNLDHLLMSLPTVTKTEWVEFCQLPYATRRILGD